MSILSRFGSTPPSRSEYLKLFLAMLANRAKTAERIVLPWSSAAKLLGDLLELDPTSLPARYRARVFPQPAMLLQLQELERQLA